MKTSCKLIAAAIALGIALLSPAALAAERPVEWGYDNTVLVSVDPATQDLAKAYSPADFPEAAVSEVRTFSRNGSQLELILLLDTKKQTVAQACEKLDENETLLYARDNYYADHPHTAELDRTEASVQVGDTITLKCSSFDLGIPGFSKNQIEVLLSNGTYEEGKTYTVEDFPEYNLKKVEQLPSDQQAPLVLFFTLETDSFTALTVALDKAGADERFSSVSSVVLPTGERPVHQWSVSDDSILSFDSDLESDKIVYNGQAVTLTANKEGTATITLQLGYANQEAVTVSCTVTVLPGESHVTTTAAPVTDAATTAPPPSQEQNPDTGDSLLLSPAIAAMAMLLMSAIALPALRVGRKRKKQ